MAKPKPVDLLATMTMYEAWVDATTPTVPAARRGKHELMAADAFGFLRASYARWVQRVAQVVGTPPGPLVNGVGDLHVENFGTWRDGQGRTAWGINDVDEADRMPAAYDLVRLATSALVATGDRKAPLSASNVVATIVEGYAGSASVGGRPYVLDGPAPQPLRPLLRPARDDDWWKKVTALPTAAALPAEARTLVDAAIPRGTGSVRYLARVAGMGSRDHLRVVAVGDLAGSPVIREIKAMSPPATWWLNGTPDDAVPGRTATTILRRARRTPDPAVRITPGWVVRRLAPWSDRIELTDLHREVDADGLLAAMGAETANVHLASTTALVLSELTTPLVRKWIKSAAERMRDDTVADWKVWRKAMS